MDNTLVDFMRMKEMAIDAACDAMIDAGLKMEKKVLKEKIYKIYEEKGIEFQEVFNLLLERELGEIDYKILGSGIVGYRRAREFTLVPYPHTEFTLLELLKRGLKLAVISDAPKIQVWLRLCYLGFQNYFTVVVGFDDTGKRKPDPEPFIFLLNKLNLKPNETLMVGDWEERDIVGAKLLGMKTAFARYGDAFGTKETGADYELKDILELLKIIDELNSPP